VKLEGTGSSGDSKTESSPVELKDATSVASAATPPTSTPSSSVPVGGEAVAGAAEVVAVGVAVKDEVAVSASE